MKEAEAISLDREKGPRARARARVLCNTAFTHERFGKSSKLTRERAKRRSKETRGRGGEAKGRTSSSSSSSSSSHLGEIPKDNSGPRSLKVLISPPVPPLLLAFVLVFRSRRPCTPQRRSAPKETTASPPARVAICSRAIDRMLRRGCERVAGIRMAIDMHVHRTCPRTTIYGQCISNLKYVTRKRDGSYRFVSFPRSFCRLFITRRNRISVSRR